MVGALGHRTAMDFQSTNPQSEHPNDVGNVGTRLLVDLERVEWEIYDESQWDFRMALDWDSVPQTENPGLIFSSRIDRRRVWPAPPNWRGLSDDQLLALCANARSMF